MSHFNGNSSGLHRNDIYLPALQASGECYVHTVVVSENITDFKDQGSTAVIANLALPFPCGSLVQTILVKSNTLIIH